MVRFIVKNYHPSNEVLASEIIPRYAVIGWLLTRCKSVVHAQNVKLSLFLDWFTYPPAGGNVMVIEPGLLVMHHSLRKNLKITSTLLEFLCLIATEYYPAGGNLLQVGILNAFRDGRNKKVVPTLGGLLCAPSLEASLLQLVARTFPGLPTKSRGCVLLHAYVVAVLFTVNACATFLVKDAAKEPALDGTTYRQMCQRAKPNTFFCVFLLLCVWGGGAFSFCEVMLLRVFTLCMLICLPSPSLHLYFIIIINCSFVAPKKTKY